MMSRKVKAAPPANFLIGLGTTQKVSIQNPTNNSAAPVLLANPNQMPTVTIRNNHYVKVVLQNNLREPVIIVGAAPSGAFFQQTITLRPGQTVVLQAGTSRTKFGLSR